MKLVLAILQNMWGDHRFAPITFRISYTNHSGRRLYRFMPDHARLLVTNAASVCTPTAKGKAPTDLIHLASAINQQPWDLILICGKQAQAACMAIALPPCPTIELPHPAWRWWNERLIEETRLIVAEALV